MEQNTLLQCVRYIVSHDFFRAGNNSKDEDGGEKEGGEGGT